MAKPKSAKLLCTPNVFERCFLNQGHLAQVPVRLYIRKVGDDGGAEVSCTISNPAYNPNADIPQQGTGRRTNKKIKGTLKSIAKAGKIASLATLAAGNPELAAPLGAVAEAIDQVGSGDDFNAEMINAEMRGCIKDCRERRNAKVRAEKSEVSNFGETMKKLASIPKKKKKVPRYTLAAAKKNFKD